jgi:hypothetical protein
LYSLVVLLDAGLDPKRMMPGTGCFALPETVRLTSHAVAHGVGGQKRNAEVSVLAESQNQEHHPGDSGDDGVEPENDAPSENAEARVLERRLRARPNQSRVHELIGNSILS